MNHTQPVGNTRSGKTSMTNAGYSSGMFSTTATGTEDLYDSMTSMTEQQVAFLAASPERRAFTSTTPAHIRRGNHLQTPKTRKKAATPETGTFHSAFDDERNAWTELDNKPIAPSGTPPPPGFEPIDNSNGSARKLTRTGLERAGGHAPEPLPSLPLETSSQKKTYKFERLRT